MTNSEKKIYSKAKAIGYSVNKGKVHYLNTSYPVFSDDVGYNVKDNSLGCLIWGCYNEIFDHLWTLQDVEAFIKAEYKKLKLTY